MLFPSFANESINVSMTNSVINVLAYVTVMFACINPVQKTVQRHFYFVCTDAAAQVKLVDFCAI
jgi:hypothetical protein